MAVSDTRKQQMLQYYASKKHAIRQQQRGYYLRNKAKLKEKYLEKREDRLKYFKEHRAKEKIIRDNIRQKARSSRKEWNPVTSYRLEGTTAIDKPIWT